MFLKRQNLKEKEYVLETKPLPMHKYIVSLGDVYRDYYSFVFMCLLLSFVL